MFYARSPNYSSGEIPMVATIQVVDPPKHEIAIPTSSAPLQLTGWDHIAVVVPDLVEAERWYVDVLGAEVVGRYNWGGDTAHPVPPHEDIRIGKDVFTLFFFGEPTAPGPSFVHYAFNCRNMDELDIWKTHLESKNVAVRGPLAHPGFGAVSIYFQDPWGHQLEITNWFPDFETGKAEALKRGGSIMSGAQAEAEGLARGASIMGSGPHPTA
jgi:catechol 2,3-dioxygenase-like lactoylglutathione lyase family enzyme